MGESTRAGSVRGPSEGGVCEEKKVEKPRAERVEWVSTEGLPEWRYMKRQKGKEWLASLRTSASKKAEGRDRSV